MGLIGARVAVMILLVGMACVSKKKGLIKSETTLYLQQSSDSTTRTRAVNVEQFGDTLRGNVPLPFLQTSQPGVRFPYTIPVSSSGIDLQITLDNGSLSYQAVAKPQTKVSIQETESQHSATSETSAILFEEVKTKEVTGKIPWWMILIGILIALLTAGLWIVKKYFQLSR